MAVVKGILFHVGNEVYGIGILNIRGIEKVANIFPIPNAPSYISGIINLRGDVIPVFNLRDKFGLPSEPVTDATKLIIAKSKDIVVAFVVDQVKEIIEIPEEEMVDPPIIVKNVNTKYVGKVAHIRDSLVIFLDLDGLLSESEQENIEKILKETEEK